MARSRLRLAAAILLVLAVAALAALPLLRWSWALRSSNPVRRGVALMDRLGCFTCHGPFGSDGLPDPGGGLLDVPEWSGGVWMMYVEDESDIRSYILDGHAEGEPPTSEEEAVIAMPAYRDLISRRDLDDLVAAFKVLSGMVAPEEGTPEAKGAALAERWGCFACHGPGGAGGVPNPGSFTGTVPGWYGPEFDDLVRDAGEFRTWVREGTLPRLENHPVARFFLRRQRIPMPRYTALTDEEVEALWRYTRWLERSGGGVAPAADEPRGAP